MNSFIKLIIGNIWIPGLMLSACSGSVIQEYENPENGLRKQLETKNYSYIVQYKSPEYIVEIENIPSDSARISRMKELEDVISFTIYASPKNKEKNKPDFLITVNESMVALNLIYFHYEGFNAIKGAHVFLAGFDKDNKSSGNHEDKRFLKIQEVTGESRIAEFDIQ